ncbi:MAG: thioredoxin family protein [Armatimonadota bacterium]|nr:MAG: thioredoxin family protein [Armatimonadota bacterium]
MKRSGILIFVLILAVAGVLLAKRLTKRPPERPPVVAARAPQAESPAPQTSAPEASAPAASAQPTEPEHQPAPPSPTDEPKRPQTEARPAEQVKPDRPAAQSAPPAPPAAPAPQPAPEPAHPLSGADLSACLTSGRPTMADFGAGWCQPCKQMEPVLEQAAAKYAGKANIVYIDTDEYGRTARQYQIRLIPTQIFFDSEGKEIFRNIGLFPIEKIDEQLAKLGVQQ